MSRNSVSAGSPSSVILLSYTPLIDKPFTNGFIGVLMRKGQDDLLKAVNKTIERMKTDGSLKKLHDKYGLVYSLE